MRLAPLLVLASLCGCQVVAGIDDRSVAPNLDDAADTSISADGGTDTGVVEQDSSTADTGSTDDTMSILPETSDDGGDSNDASDVVDAPLDTSTTARIVINEVKASGGDFVEIYNRSTTTIDISNWGLTGTNDTGGFSAPVRFASGTTLAPGAWLLILAGMTSQGGPHTACGPGGPSSCYYVDFGISQSRGETLRVLRADDSIEDEYAYPKNSHADSLSWGRVPDGTGAFVVTSPTPGAANVKL